MKTWIEEPQTQLTAARVAAGLGVMAVVAAGAPAIEEAVAAQNDKNEWRLKARAFVEAEAAGDVSAEPEDASATTKRLVERSLEARPRADRLALASFESFAPEHFDLAERQREDHECLSRAIYYEAGTQSSSGQLAVAEVVMNRVRHRLYPNNVCDVVYQGSERRTGCQFTFTCDGAEGRAPKGQTWVRARLVASNALMGLSRPVTAKATHYHADYVQPYWAPTLVQTHTIGAHIFYRIPSRSDRVHYGA